MNIQEAKEEIIRTVKAYTAVDEDGQPVIPVSAQRPLLLMGPPGIGKTAGMERRQRSAMWDFCPIQSPTIPDRARWVCRSLCTEPMTEKNIQLLSIR